MKKRIAAGLVCVVLCLTGLAIGAEADGPASGVEEKSECAYLAIVHRFDSFASILDFVEGDADTSRLDTDNTVWSALCFSRPAVMFLPEGIVWDEMDSFIGVRVTFDQPFDTFLDPHGMEMLKIPFGVILEPTRVEIVGDVVYGAIAEIGEDYMILGERDENGLATGTLSRYTITPDTMMWHESPDFRAGSGCMAIVDQDGVVLAMEEGNG